MPADQRPTQARRPQPTPRPAFRPARPAPRRASRRSALLPALIVLAALGAGVYLLGRSRTIQLFGKLVARVETPKRLVALTFDDGPNPQMVDEIIAPLAARRVRATFFVVGSQLALAPEAGRRLVAAGHELGNQSYSHEHMILKSPSFIRSEVERTDALIRGAGEHGEIYFRPPFSWKLVGLPWYLWRTGRTSVTWDVEADSDPKAVATADGLAAYAVARVRPGSIILLHVWDQARATSRAAIPILIERLQKEGYRFVTVSELLFTQRSSS